MALLTLKLDPCGSEPMYLQLYRAAASEIMSGRLKSGDKLPSTRHLCSHLKISRSTAEGAYDILMQEGYIYSKPKSGYYVCELTPLNRPAQGRGMSAAPLEGGLPPAGGPSYDFSTSDVDTAIFPYASWAKIAKETVYQNKGLLKKGDKQGDLELRQALCSFLRDYRGVVCAPDQIVLGGGMEHLLDIIVKLLPQNCLFGIENPGYSTAFRSVHINGRSYCPLELDSEGIAPESLYKQAPDVIFATPSHQFPLGITMPAGRRTALLSWAHEREGRYIIEDDYDSEFRHLSRPIPAMQGLDTQGRVIYISSFSRSIAPSFRAAYMVLPQGLLARYNELFKSASCYVSRFEQHTLYLFISRGLYARHLRRAGNAYSRRAAIISSQLLTLPGGEITGGDAGLHFVFTHPLYTGRELAERALSAGVLVRDLLGYYISKPPSPMRSVVIGYGGLSDESALKAAQLLVKAWR